MKSFLLILCLFGTLCDCGQAFASAGKGPAAEADVPGVLIPPLSLPPPFSVDDSVALSPPPRPASPGPREKYGPIYLTLVDTPFVNPLYGEGPSQSPRGEDPDSFSTFLDRSLASSWFRNFENRQGYCTYKLPEQWDAADVQISESERAFLRALTPLNASTMVIRAPRYKETFWGQVNLLAFLYEVKYYSVLQNEFPGHVMALLQQAGPLTSVHLTIAEALMSLPLKRYVEKVYTQVYTVYGNTFVDPFLLGQFINIYRKDFLEYGRCCQPVIAYISLHRNLLFFAELAPLARRAALVKYISGHEHPL
jgi:hypothetical protein